MYDTHVAHQIPSADIKRTVVIVSRVSCEYKFHVDSNCTSRSPVLPRA